ncbi:MAG: energy transducer TonB [Phycisphaerae bacterium]|nr:energy transducer TonB [Phycisphaerae bacterium]
MNRGSLQHQSVGFQTGRSAWFWVIAAIGVNAMLFYVLALARTKPSAASAPERDMMRIISIDVPMPSEVEPDSRDPAMDVVQLMPEETLAVSVRPAVDSVPSFLPRLSDWIGDVSPDLAGLPVVLPALSDLSAPDAAPASGLGERLSVLKVDRVPSRIAGAPPRYPQWARRAGLDAVVTLRFVVTARGAVENVKIHSIEGDERFGDEAVRAIAAWRFSPAVKGGKPVACWCFQKVSFKLVN